QQCVGHSVTDHVGIGMSHQSPRMGDPLPPQDQRPPFLQPVCVMADTDPQVIGHGSWVTSHWLTAWNLCRLLFSAHQPVAFPTRIEPRAEPLTTKDQLINDSNPSVFQGW